LIVGRVIDIDIKPCFAVLNRGTPMQVIVSPS